MSVPLVSVCSLGVRAGSQSSVWGRFMCICTHVMWPQCLTVIEIHYILNVPTHPEMCTLTRVLESLLLICGNGGR